MLGYARQEVVGRRFIEFSHPEDVQSSAEVFAGLTSGARSTASYDRRYIRRDGAVVWAHVNLSAVRDESERPAVG